MPIQLGSTNIIKAYLGSTEVTKAYLGSVEVFGGVAVDPTLFIMTVKTDNVGASANNQYEIPTYNGYNYNYDVTTSDGQTILGNTGNLTITFPSAGTYDISITGLFERIYNKNANDNSKIIDIKQWGTNNWKSFSGGFWGCDNLTVVTATDIPNLSELTNMSTMFMGCTNLTSVNLVGWNTSTVNFFIEFFMNSSLLTNADVSNWDVSSCVNFSNFFYGNGAIPYSLANWDVTAGTNFANLMTGSPGMSKEDYDSTLISWASQTLNLNESVNFGGSEYCSDLAQVARETLVNDFGWTITDGGLSATCPVYFKPFIITVKTDNVGTSADNQFTIPATGTYDIDWGDGTIELGVTDTQTHTYSVAGTYDIEIKGGLTKVSFGASNDNPKLIDIKQWGDIAWTSFNNNFNGTTSLGVITAIDAPNLSGVTNMAFAFRNSNIISGNFGIWDTSTITSLNGMFNGASQFNDDIGNWNTSANLAFAGIFRNNNAFDYSLANWDISNGTSFDNFMTGATGFSPTNYDSTLISWASQAPQLNQAPNFGGSKYCSDAAQIARQSLIDDYGWTITDGGLAAGCVDIFSTFIMTIQTDNVGTSLDTQFNLPTNDSFVYDYTLTTSDGQVINRNIADDLLITFPSAGTYDIKISGIFPSIIFFNEKDAKKLIDIKQWGDIAWTELGYGFYGCTNLIDFTATDVPNLSNASSLNASFATCSSLVNPDFSGWDVSTITNLNACFFDNANLETLGITNWNVSNVIDFGFMFSTSPKYNEFLNWTTSAATSMSRMFNGCTAYNQSVASFDISGVADLLDFMNGLNLSTANYDAILIAFANQDAVNSLAVNFGSSVYTYGGVSNVARQSLIDDDLWTITDGGSNNLIVNGTFDTNVSGWIVSGYGGSLTWNPLGKADVSNESVVAGGALQVVQFVIGTQTLKFDASNLVGTPSVFVSIDGGGSVIPGTAVQTIVNGANEYTFNVASINANPGANILYFYDTASGILTEYTIDNVSIAPQ